MNNRQLSPHISLYDLTRTSHAEFQEENRAIDQEQELKLGEVANLDEQIIVILGCDLDLHSGYRCLGLNRSVGSSDGSQHRLCEANDISPRGPDTEETVTDAWQKIATAVHSGKIKVGQLLLESRKEGREGRVWWIHVSLGYPYREKKHCGQIATLIDGKFTLIAQIA